MEGPFPFLELPRDLQGMVAVHLGPRDLRSFRRAFPGAREVVRRGYVGLGCLNAEAVVLIQRRWRERWRRHARVAKEPKTKLFFERLRSSSLALQLLPRAVPRPHWAAVLREFHAGHVALLKRVLQRRDSRLFHATVCYWDGLLPLWMPVMRMFVAEGEQIDKAVRSAYGAAPEQFPGVDSSFALALVYGFDSCFCVMPRVMFEDHAKKCPVGHLDRCVPLRVLLEREELFNNCLRAAYAELGKKQQIGMFFD